MGGARLGRGLLPVSVRGGGDAEPVLGLAHAGRPRPYAGAEVVRVGRQHRRVHQLHGPRGGAVLQRIGTADSWHATGGNYHDSLGGVLVDWAQAVRAGREPVASMREGVRDAVVMAAIAESAETGRPVDLLR